jgi:hypothetical protein
MHNASSQHSMEPLRPNLQGDSRPAEVEIRLDSETATQVVGLFDALGVWLSDGGLDTCQIGFGDRSYTLLAALLSAPNDATGFLLERTLQLQTALDSRIVLEQAKGILAERDQVDTDEAFRRMRLEARSRRMKLHDLATGVSRPYPLRATDSSAFVHRSLASD